MNESTLVPRKEWESDLDWLARNVHVWPTSTPHIVPAGDSVFEFGITFCENHACVYHREYTDSKVIYKKQWLARRAELQNKPSWKDAPEWAQWLAQDEDGEWFWYEKEPSRGDNLFRHASGFVCYAQEGCALGDWRDTLEKRPEQTITDVCSEVTDENRHKDVFEPFVSVEDAVREFDVAYHASKQVYAATAKQPSPKGSGNPILGMVLADLTNRALEGKEKYGEPLLAHNGRNPLWDAYQEALDLAMYLRQAIEEQK